MAKADAAASKKKRTRRRKRREVSESPSESSDDSGADSDAAGAVEIIVPTQKSAPVATPAVEESDDTESDEDDSSDEDEDDEMDASGPAPQEDVEMLPTEPAPRTRLPSRSPSPPSAALAPFLPSAKDAREEKEKLLKERFRKYWMASLADGFADDLDEIRKEPSMTKSRLEMLIDSLASGADVFSSSVDESSRKRTTEEMELVLGER